MKPFTESMRYEYPLTKDSVVMDVGCHVGTFSRILSDKYGCKIFAFEPVKHFFDQAVAALSGSPNVQCFNFGVGSYTRNEIFGVKGDMSGAFADSEFIEEVSIVDFVKVIEKWCPCDIDLIKINIEGGEFELLEYIIAKGGNGLFKNIQVQFHNVVPNCVERHAAIRGALLLTHQLTYDAPWCWENYERIQIV